MKNLKAILTIHLSEWILIPRRKKTEFAYVNGIQTNIELNFFFSTLIISYIKEEKNANKNN